MCKVRDIIIFIHILELEHEIYITASEDKPRAGENLTLTCTVRCEFSTMVKWVNETQNGDALANASITTVSEKRRNVWTSQVNITFRPLLASHAVTYKCISYMTSTDSDVPFRRKQKRYLLRVSSKH